MASHGDILYNTQRYAVTLFDFYTENVLPLFRHSLKIISTCEERAKQLLLPVEPFHVTGNPEALSIAEAFPFSILHQRRTPSKDRGQATAISPIIILNRITSNLYFFFANGNVAILIILLQYFNGFFLSM